MTALPAASSSSSSSALQHAAASHAHASGSNASGWRSSASAYVPETERATLPDGEEVFVNDHVYAAPPWSERDGASYHVARIIEFVPAEAARHALSFHHLEEGRGGESSRSKQRHVRLGFYYRQSEISGRSASDHRLLFAAIHSEVHPISWLRGKCYVRHRDKIGDLSDWKKRPNHFHYLRLYDPYIKREYELVRTEMVQNVPAVVRKTLIERYEFVAVEKEMVADLTDGFRSCATCHAWASSQESVRCDACKLHYHMACVQPPLQSKPAKGYSWVCLSCIRSRLIASGELLPTDELPPQAQPRTMVSDLALQTPLLANLAASSPSASGRPSRSRQSLTRAAREKERSATPQIETQPDRYFRGWNCRYFGQYTDAYDTLDPDDSIWPRLAIRLGQRYQAVVPDWEDQAKVSAEMFGDDLPERGTDEKHTSIKLSEPTFNMGPFMRQVRGATLALPATDLEVQIKALLLKLNQGPLMAIKTLETCKPADFRHVRDFNETELAQFEEEIEKFGALEQHSLAKKIGRKPAEVVRLYYRWRNQKLVEQNRKIRAARDQASGMSRRKKKKGRPPKQAKALTAKHAPLASASSAAIMGMQRTDGDESDVEGSEWEPDEIPDKQPSCAICSTKSSKKWWKAPRSQNGLYLCEACGLSYRKYGVAIPYKPYLASLRRTSERRDSPPVEAPPPKRQKTAPSRPATPPPPPPPPPQPCLLCFEAETSKKPLARCSNCGLSAHTGCYGIPFSDLRPDWLCDPCANEQSMDASLDVSCVLCPTTLPNKKRPSPRNLKGPAPDFDFLHVVRPTEGYKWVHVLCATYTRQCKFSDWERLRPVEGIMDITSFDDQSCLFCDEVGGAIVSCRKCPETFHASCGWLSGCSFGFEVHQPLSERQLHKVPKRDRLPNVDFSDLHGRLTPVAWCKAHSAPGEAGAESRAAFRLHDLDSASKLSRPPSALQVYVQHYKQVADPDAPEGNGLASFPLLRKAQRIKNLLPGLIRSVDDLDALTDKARSGDPSPDAALQAVRSKMRKPIESSATSGRIKAWAERCQCCHTTFSPRWYEIRVSTRNRVQQRADGGEMALNGSYTQRELPSYSWPDGMVPPPSESAMATVANEDEQASVEVCVCQRCHFDFVHEGRCQAPEDVQEQDDIEPIAATEATLDHTNGSIAPIEQDVPRVDDHGPVSAQRDMPNGRAMSPIDVTVKKDDSDPRSDLDMPAAQASHKQAVSAAHQAQPDSVCPPPTSRTMKVDLDASNNDVIPMSSSPSLSPKKVTSSAAPTLNGFDRRSGLAVERSQADKGPTGRVNGTTASTSTAKAKEQLPQHQRASARSVESHRETTALRVHDLTAEPPLPPPVHDSSRRAVAQHEHVFTSSAHADPLEPRPALHPIDTLPPRLPPSSEPPGPSLPVPSFDPYPAPRNEGHPATESEMPDWRNLNSASSLLPRADLNSHQDPLAFKANGESPRSKPKGKRSSQSRTRTASPNTHADPPNHAAPTHWSNPAPPGVSYDAAHFLYGPTDTQRIAYFGPSASNYNDFIGDFISGPSRWDDIRRKAHSGKDPIPTTSSTARVDVNAAALPSEGLPDQQRRLPMAGERESAGIPLLTLYEGDHRHLDPPVPSQYPHAGPPSHQYSRVSADASERNYPGGTWDARPDSEQRDRRAASPPRNPRHESTSSTHYHYESMRVRANSRSRSPVRPTRYEPTAQYGAEPRPAFHPSLASLVDQQQRQDFGA